MFINQMIPMLLQQMQGQQGARQSYQPQGLLGGQMNFGGAPMNTANLMQQYLQNLYMRRYQTPAIQQQPGMVSSQMGPGGMQYRAPTIQPAANDPTRNQAARPNPFAPSGNMTPWGNPFDPNSGAGA